MFNQNPNNRSLSLNDDSAPATTAIMAVCITLFILSLFFPSLKMSTGLAPAYWQDAPWTIFTSLFMHASIMHIVFNMFALYSVRNLEEQIGTPRFVLYYFLMGLGGSLCVIALGQPNTIHMGASGAILGLFGFYLIGWWDLAIKNTGLIFTLVLCAAMSFTGGVSWEAHAGGFAVGALLGLIYREKSKRSGVTSMRR